jgi:ribonuclease P protein component
MPGLLLQMRQRTQQDIMGSEAAASDAMAMRVGITATRKLGGAVVRNRVRRRLRALAAKVLPDLGRSGCDYVLIGRPLTAARPHPDLCSDLRVALAKVHAGRGRPPRAIRPANAKMQRGGGHR